MLYLESGKWSPKMYINWLKQISKMGVVTPEDLDASIQLINENISKMASIMNKR